MIRRPFALLLAGGVVAGAAAWSTRADGTSVSVPPEAAPPSGADLFLAKGCAVCHVGPDSIDGLGVAPSLAAASTWAGSRVSGLSAQDYLAQSILDPGAVVSPAARGADLQMPPIAMDPEEVDALVAHLLAD